MRSFIKTGLGPVQTGPDHPSCRVQSSTSTRTDQPGPVSKTRPVGLFGTLVVSIATCDPMAVRQAPRDAALVESGEAVYGCAPAGRSQVESAAFPPVISEIHCEFKIKTWFFFPQPSLQKIYTPPFCISIETQYASMLTQLVIPDRCTVSHHNVWYYIILRAVQTHPWSPCQSSDMP